MATRRRCRWTSTPVSGLATCWIEMIDSWLRADPSCGRSSISPSISLAWKNLSVGKPCACKYRFFFAIRCLWSKADHAVGGPVSPTIKKFIKAMTCLGVLIGSARDHPQARSISRQGAGALSERCASARRQAVEVENAQHMPVGGVSCAHPPGRRP